MYILAVLKHFPLGFSNMNNYNEYVFNAVLHHDTTIPTDTPIQALAATDGTWEIDKTYEELDVLYIKGILLKLRWQLNEEDHLVPLTRKYTSNDISYFEFTEVTAQPTEDSTILVYHRFAIGSDESLTYSTGTVSGGDSTSVIEYVNERLDNYDTFSVTIGNRKYRAEKINNQLWLATNLDYQFPGLDVAPTDVPTAAAAWYYNNNEQMYGLSGSRKCGLLYNWHAVKYLEDNADTLLPSGWHVATNDEWTALVALMGSNDAGRQVKSLDKSANGVWPVNWGGTDQHALAIHPGGMRNSDGNFMEEGIGAHIWTSTEVLETTAYHRMLRNQSANLFTAAYDKSYGMSVRLVLDLNPDGSIPEGSGVTQAFATKEYVDAMLGNIESLLASL